jgi:hypothetical protein
MVTSFVIALALMAAPLAPNDQVPQIEFKDIEGVKGSSADFSDWIIVYSVADRESSDPLMEWREKVGLAVTRRYPGLKIANLNFADLTAVPSFMRHVVNPILRSINNRATEKMKKLYADKKIPLSDDTARFHLIPDYDGKYLEAMGVKDAEKFRCWLVKDGVVVATFTQGDPDLDAAYLKAFASFAGPVTE